MHELRGAARRSYSTMSSVTQQVDRQPRRSAHRPISIAEVDQAIINVICARARGYPGWQVMAEMDAETRLTAQNALLRGLVTNVV
jgi:hypothetical protein